jgi:hypothetical protein
MISKRHGFTKVRCPWPDFYSIASLVNLYYEYSARQVQKHHGILGKSARFARMSQTLDPGAEHAYRV